MALSAGVLTMAVAIAEGVRVPDAQMIATCGLVAVFAAISWQVERRLDVDGVARAVDRHFGQAGAVLTAHQAESARPRSPVTPLLSREVAQAVTWQAFARRTARNSALLVAAPFASLALLGLAVEAAQGAQDSSGTASWPTDSGGLLATQVRTRADQLARLASKSEIPESLAGKLGALAAQAAALEPAASSSVAPAEGRRERARALARELEELERSIGAPRVTLAPGDGTMADPDRRADSPPSASMQDTRANLEMRAPGGDARTPGAVTPRGAEGAAPDARWWPARFDAIVEGWVEAERTARDGRSR